VNVFAPTQSLLVRTWTVRVRGISPDRLNNTGASLRRRALPTVLVNATLYLRTLYALKSDERDVFEVYTTNLRRTSGRCDPGGSYNARFPDVTLSFKVELTRRFVRAKFERNTRRNVI